MYDICIYSLYGVDLLLGKVYRSYQLFKQSELHFYLMLIILKYTYIIHIFISLATFYKKQASEQEMVRNTL